MTQKLFSVVNSITNNKLSNPLLENKTDEELGNDFADYFIGKNTKNQQSVQQYRRIPTTNHQYTTTKMFCTPYNGRGLKRNNINEEQVLQTGHHFYRITQRNATILH